ncbi:MAG TPA: carboxypeptidase regulatory-like domain-containing protein [Thermoanaerobaculia bacterium]|nr:carboxypeptidase regulatory-like domain-containing protein [Thermoanaerobaculia bacterium]
MTRSRKSAVLCGAAALAWGALVMVGCGGQKEAAPAGGEAAAPAAPAAPAAAGPTGTATVAGKVTYDGAVPKLPPVSMSADPTCAAKHTSAVANPVLELGANKELGNVFVYVKSGLPDNATWAPPTTAAAIDQNGCMYVPHVVGVMVGQPLDFINSDGILHNVHALPKVNQEFNVAMPGEVKKSPDHTFDQAEGMFLVKCDVHPWMNAYVGVIKHPFFAVTGADGSFTIKNLPAGKYTIAAWQEKMGEQTQDVTVADNGTATANFTFTRPAAAPGT